MAATKFWRKKLLTFELETVYGTDPVPTPAANAILGSNVRLSPMMGTDVARETEQPWLGNQGGFLADLHSTLSFDVELEGSGTAGTAPGWGPLLRACGMAETIVAATSVAYNPVSDDHEAGTFYLNVDGTEFQFSGARGNAKFTVAASGVPMITFSFTGLYGPAAEVALGTPDYSAFTKPRVATAAHTPVFTVDGISLVMSSFELDLANQVEPDFQIGPEAEANSIDIVDRSPAIATTVRAVPLTSFDPFTAAEALTEMPVVLTHGTVAGKITTISAPTAQLLRIDGMDEAKGKVTWPLRFAPIPQTGGDDFTITLT